MRDNDTNDDVAFFFIIFAGVFIWIVGWHIIKGPGIPAPEPFSFFDWIELIIGGIITIGFCVNGWRNHKKKWVCLLILSFIFMYYMGQGGNPPDGDMPLSRVAGRIFLLSLGISMAIFSSFKIYDKNLYTYIKK